MKTTLLILFTFLFVLSTKAATFTVTNLNDDGAGSLRKAIADANANSDADTINFQNGLNGTITLTSGELLISQNLTIAAPNLITVQRNTSDSTPNFRIFNISIGVTATITNLKISNGRAALDNLFGGGIRNDGTLILNNSIVSDNGAIDPNRTSVSAFSSGAGGGIYSKGTLSLVNCQIENNSVSALSSSGGGVENAGTMTIINSVFRNNLSATNSGLTNPGNAEGGGLYNGGNATITNSVFETGNRSGGRYIAGGGIYNSGALNILDSTIKESFLYGTNSTSANGGGIYNAGSLDVTRSTVSNNSNNGGVGAGNCDGGGIYSTGTLNITNSTIANNGATSYNSSVGRGGGLFTSRGMLKNVTIFGNSARGDVGAGGGGIYAIGSGISLFNTIVSDNTSAATNGNTSPIPPDVAGAISSQGNNLISNSNGSSGWIASDILNVNAQLGAFGDNGGATQTVALLQNSPAINAGNNNNAPATDQRGFTRIIGGTIDIGAYELQTVCTYEISPTAIPSPAASGTATVNITTQAGCAWTAQSNSSGATVSPSSGTGSGAVTVAVSQNTGPARVLTLIIAGQVYTVNQASGCSFNVSPTFVILPTAGGSATIEIAASDQQCPWTTSAGSSGATISPASGTGNGTVTLTAPPNVGPGRFVTVTIAGQTVTFRQEQGCSYAISPTSANFGAAGGTGTISITSSSSECGWSAIRGELFVSITGSPSGFGNGTIFYSVAANNAPARSTTITVAGYTFTVNQENGCTYAISPASQMFPAAGGTGTINVTASNQQCPWSALSNVPWISTFSGGNTTGSGTLQYSVAANIAPARTGTITVAGQIFTINQANGCRFTFNQNEFYFPASGGNAQISVSSGPGCQWTAFGDQPWIQITSGNSGAGNGAFSFTVAANPINDLRTGNLTIADQTILIRQASATANKPAFDFDGDRKADFAIFRPSNGVWYSLNSAGGIGAIQFGSATDKLVPADYDNDGKTDVAVYRNGTWYIQRSNLGFTTAQFGEGTDIPQPADFDGDGRADLAVFRPSTGIWYLNRSTLGFYAVQFGSNGDKPITGDFDGDNRADIGVFRPSTGIWYIQQSAAGFYAVQFGASDDKPIAADFDADGKTDIAIFRPSTGTWYLNRSTAGITSVQFGQTGDAPAAADYDGDGRADVAVYRNGVWYLNRSTQGFTGIQFGESGDLSVQSAFVR